MSETSNDRSRLTLRGTFIPIHAADQDKCTPHPYELVAWVAEHGKLPVVNFSAGGIATPADAALMMQLGAEGVFVGSGIFKSTDPAGRAKAIVEATTHFSDPAILARVSRGLGEAMPGLEIGAIGPENLIQHRGW